MISRTEEIFPEPESDGQSAEPADDPAVRRIAVIGIGQAITRHLHPWGSFRRVKTGVVEVTTEISDDKQDKE